MNENGAIPPARMELVSPLSDPHAYEHVVDALPDCPAKRILQALGSFHHLYPRRAQPPQRPAAGALLSYWMQRRAWPPEVRPAEGGA
jgi:hypothetical protein